MNGVLQFLGVLLAGILAGEEVVVRYGVHPALMTLDDRAHLEVRQALVRRLRVVVPAIMGPTVLVAVAVLVFGGPGPGLALRWAAVLVLVAFVVLSFLGTVPINIRVLDWDVDAPPADWLATVRRWGRIDIARSSAAVIGFGCVLVAALSA